MGRYEELPPLAGSMIASMRAIGYDLSMAIADLIDNSIFAGANNIWIRNATGKVLIHGYIHLMMVRG